MRTTPPKDPIKYVDWLLDHLRDNLGVNMRHARIWEFVLRTKTIEDMRALSRALDKAKYATTEQSVVPETTVSPSGRSKTISGPPMVSAFWRGAPSAATLKRRVSAIIAIAKKHGARYDGLSSMDQEEFEMLYGPPRAMSLADATWRLRNYSDTGLKKGAKIAFTFCVTAKDPKACRAALRRAELGEITPAPRDADWTISLDISGVNDEKRLKMAFGEMKRAIAAAGGVLKGVMV